MRRITLWTLSTLSAVVLLFGYHTSTSGPTTVASTPAQAGSFGSDSSTSPSSSPSAGSGSGGDDDDATTPSATPSASASPSSGSSAAKTVAGSVADTRWGPVQVQLTIAGGKITTASVLQYPQNNGRDIEINDQALPILTQETVTAQSADIDMVSGATYTSDGYIESLQAALDTAGL